MSEADLEEWRGWLTDWVDRRMPNGEAFMEFYDRVTRGLEQIIKENKGKHVLIVSHNGALSAMHCHLTGAGSKAFCGSIPSRDITVRSGFREKSGRMTA